MSATAMMHGGDGQMMHGWMSAWMALWGVLGVALTVLAVAATIWLVKHLTDNGQGSRKLLEERYAAGELTREEFVQRSDDLGLRK